MFRFDQNTVRPRRTNPVWSIPVSKIPSPIKYNDKPRKTIKISKAAVRKYFEDYCEGTTLHGLRYVGLEGLSIFERIFWILSFMGAMGFAAFFISNIYDKWTLSPVIVGINPEFKSIADIPFPAITICNMNQANKAEAQKIIAGNNDAEKLLLEDVCNLNETLTQQKGVNATDWEFIKRFILKVSQPCSELLVNCKWIGRDESCRELFNSAITDEGVCCTFNRVSPYFMYHKPLTLATFNISTPGDQVDWSPENGYPPNATNITWPFRAAGAGAHLGLSLVINIAADDYYCSSTSSIGLKIRLHSPVETPMMTDFGFIVHPRKEVRISIRPMMDEATPSIDKIPISKRQCYFSHEKKLFFYRTYTKMNCELECISNYTLVQCGCVPFFLPKDFDTTICDKEKEECHMKAKTDMDVLLRPTKYCSCLPACNELTYAQDHSMGDLSSHDLLRPEANTTDLRSIIITHFFYPTTQFRSYQKSELFGFTEFLSNSGGLLGLFLGFSFLSAVEIGYHLTLRLWCVYYRKIKSDEKDILVYPFAR